ncbi:MAG: chromosome segregation protein SMC [Bacteroidia bacterium]|nr:chromosome segregation protein SMC [Bacteroidia bacterium]
MLLKSLEIQGFKSFSDKTKLYFDSGVTGIVGPNGCGKSNVIDAIRWVLGEQKTRNLRSDKMENVIFNGTEKRKRANICEVSITFENNRGLLPPEFPTVCITRRLYRDGDAEYLINNVSCRLKDIHALFLDTGIGSDSYAIIELKMVDELLNDKENSRRNLFEEAAGISRYKLRKKETLRKLEDVQNDLLRLDDIIYEVEKSLNTLSKQVKRAEKYQEFRQQYKRASLQFTFLSTETLRSTSQKLTQEAQNLEDQITQTRTLISTKEVQLTNFQQQTLTTRENAAHIQEQITELMDVIRQKEYEKNLRTEKVKHLNQRAAEIETNYQKYQVEIENFSAQELTLETTIDSANERYDQHEYLIQELEESISQLQGHSKTIKINLDNALSQKRHREQDLAKQNRELDILKTTLQSLENELKQKQQDVNSRQETTDEVAQNIATLQHDIAQLQQELKDTQNTQSQIEESIKEHKQQLEVLQETLRNATRTLDAKNNERKLLSSLVNSLEGFPESVRFLKKNKHWTANTVLLSDIFSCTEAYRTAVEHFLEPYLSYFVVQTRQEAIEAIALLVQQGVGRARFFILDDIKKLVDNQQNINEYSLLNQIHCQPQYQLLAQFLFQKTQFHEHISDWLAISATDNILLHNGQIWLGNGQLSGGKAGLFEGKRIGRALQLEQLEAEIAEITNKNQTLQNQINQTQTKLQESITQKPTQQIETLNKQLQLKQRDLHVLQAREHDFQKLIQQTETRAQETQRKLDQIQSKITTIAPQIEEAYSILDTLTQECENLQKNLDAKQTKLSSEQQKLNHALIQFEQVKSIIQASKQEIRFIREQKNVRITAINQYQAEKEEITKNLNTLIQTPEIPDNTLLNAYENLKKVETQKQAQEEHYQTALHTAQILETEIHKKRKQKEDLELSLNQNKDKRTEVSLKISALEERLRVEFQLEFSQLTEESLFKNGRPALSIDELQAEITSLRTKIAEFGEVNLTAIETHREIKERYDFMQAQRQDLLSAETDLKNTIQEIDETAQTRFMEAFQAIQKNFIQVFRSLFTEKDSCNLVLLNPNDPLESPIDILAQPKGKRPLTINQLSGGEKTLTAISLLFAIYLLKPAPFCIFDEVDAPLDDTNIDKFNHIIRDFSGNSQFIIVTHNKRTMMATNTIFGVTMEEAGVSKVLPVDFEKLQLAEDKFMGISS